MSESIIGPMSYQALNAQQLATVNQDYAGEIVSVARKSGEYSDECTFGYAATVTLSTGWRVTVGRYGAVLAETRPVSGPPLLLPCGLYEQADGSYAATA